MSPTPDFIVGLRENVGHALLTVSTAGTFTFDEDGRVLMVHHTSGLWMNPGGIAEPLESPADTAVRETFEEAGLLVEVTRLVGVFGGPDYLIRYANGDELSCVATHFEARVIGGELRPDEDEVLDARFFTPDEARALDLTARKRRELELALDRDARPYFHRATWRP